LSCTNFRGIIDNISATNENICSGFGHDESGIVSDINEIVTIFSTNLRNAALGSRAVSKNAVLQKSKKKRKQNKPWHDDECKIKLRHVKSLGRLLNKSPWQRGLRHKVLFEKKQYNKLLRKKYRAFKAKLLNNLLDTSDKNPTEFWKVVHKLKDKCNEDPSSTIAPQEWCKYFHNLMNVRYDNNFEVDSMNNYIQCNNDVLNVDITAEELFKAAKGLKNKKSCGFDGICNEMIKVSCNTNYILHVDIFKLILKSGKYPSTWRENFIKPLFKGGSTNDPSCYRGIAISSCLSKLFTRMLLNRLEKYLENNNIICPDQIAFKRGGRELVIIYLHSNPLLINFSKITNIFLLVL
jgi:hypothetical protein